MSAWWGLLLVWLFGVLLVWALIHGGSKGPGALRAVRAGGRVLSVPVIVVLALVAVTIGALIGHLLLVLGIA